MGHDCVHNSCDVLLLLLLLLCGCACYCCWPCLFAGCILELEGCCYVANSTLLLERVSQLAADTASWPIVVSFTGADPHRMQEGAEQQQLQQQLKQLHTVLQQGLGAAGQHACSKAGNNQHACSTPSGPQGASVELPDAPEGQSVVPAAGAAAVADGQEWLPLIKLGNCQNLPAMPTLNGFLLGYPVVYHVRDLQEAGVASRMLSASQLQLHRVVATCAAQLTAVLQAAGDQRSNQAAAHQACDKVVLMSFTLPATAESADAQEKVQQTVHRVRGRQVELPDIWQALELSVISVGPQAVSL